MTNLSKLGAAGLALACAAGGVFAQTRNHGPDVIVGDLHNLMSYGTVTVNSVAYNAFAVGTTSCNRGDVPVNWYDNSNSTPNVPQSQWNWHPVIGLNLFRWKQVDGAGRFEQIGMSWLKQGFTALQGDACTLGCTANPNGDRLGVGCSDPYGASLNGSQGTGDLGPRSAVNAHTGVFPFPVVYAPSMTVSSLLSRRIIVRNDDINPAMNTGAMYWAEGQYVTQDDAQYINLAGDNPVGATDNDNNNSSYRRVSFTYNASTGAGTIGFLSGQSTVRERGAIYAWATAEPGVAVNTFDIPNEGRFVVGFKVTPIAGGLYHYEYAIANMNSDRSGYGLRINYPAGRGSAVSPANIGFSAPDYHSGEVFDNSDWASSSDGTGIEWHSTQTFAQNPNANALRFGTTYTFRFDSPRPPVSGTATFAIFKPVAGQPDSVAVPMLVPSTPSCDIDFNNDTLTPDTQDIDAFLAVFGGADCPTASCDTIDFNRDAIYPDTDDISDFLAMFGGAPCV